MKLSKVTRKIRCDVGGCGGYAAFALASGRTGTHTSIYLCDDCARALYQALARAYGKKRVAEKETSHAEA